MKKMMGIGEEADEFEVEVLTNLSGLGNAEVMSSYHNIRPGCGCWCVSQHCLEARDSICCGKGKSVMHKS